MDEKKLQAFIEYFHAKGATNPESWAEEEMRGDESLTVVFEILERLFFQFQKKQSVDYFKNSVQKKVSAKYAISPVQKEAQWIQEMLECGVKEETINNLLQIHAILAYMSFASIIDGVTFIPGRKKDTEWALFEVDTDGKPIRPVSFLHDRLFDETFIQKPFL